MGKAAYMKRQYFEAEKYFESCLKLDEKNYKANIELARSKSRTTETTSGVFDFEKIIKEYSNRKNLNFDVADYQSPKITVVDIPNKSKGVIASENIKKGTLLVVSKAISAVLNILEPKNFSTNITSTTTEEESQSFQNLNFVNTIYRMQSNPELAKQVYSLYAGPNYNRDEKLNEFTIDIPRIDQILKLNSFGVDNLFESINGIRPDSNQKESGLWIYPSFFNHSCVENAHRVFFGDLFVLYAKRDISKNEEITVRYFDGAENYSIRKKTALNRGFRCDCPQCKFDSVDKNLMQRESLVDELLLKRKKLRSISFNETLEDVKMMRQVYSDGNLRKTGLALALQHLAMKYRVIGDFKQSAEIFEEIYHISKEACELVSIFSLKQAFNDYELCSLHKKSKWCYEKASEYYGDNLTFFKRLWDNIIVESNEFQ